MKTRYKIMLTILGVAIICALFIVQSYALWTYTAVQEKNNEMTTGCFKIEFKEGGNSINLTNTYPVSDSIGLSQTPYSFTISNTCTINTNYTVLLNTINTNTMADSKIKFAIHNVANTKPTTGINLGTHEGNVNNINKETSDLNISNLSKSINIMSGNISAGSSVTINLYLWIDQASGNEVMGQIFEAIIATRTVATSG